MTRLTTSVPLLLAAVVALWGSSSASATPTVHGCPRPISYDHGAFEGGIYNFGFMPCHKARTVAREEMEGHHVPGFRCVEVRPNRVEPEGATRCTAGRAFVVFASE